MPNSTCIPLFREREYLLENFDNLTINDLQVIDENLDRLESLFSYISNAPNRQLRKFSKSLSEYIIDTREDVLSLRPFLTPFRMSNGKSIVLKLGPTSHFVEVSA